jgi:putative transposase
MTEEQRQRHVSAVADFRYSIIGDLYNPYLSREDQAKLIRQKAQREYDIPGTDKKTITEATIRNWLKIYRAGGKEALEPKRRSDRGRPKAFTDKEAAALTEILEKNPELSAHAAVRILFAKRKMSGFPSSSSVSRFVRANGLDRKSRLKASYFPDRRRFAFEKPLECVQADCMHGIMVRCGDKKRRKAILLAFIDDATRRIVYGRFGTSEKSIHFEDGIKHILLSHGRIGKLYTDNGSTFVSKQTKRIMDTLSIHMPHSKPYTPQGRGKIERFFRTVRDQFLRPLGDVDLSLDELNMVFTAWLEAEYHRSIHSSLGVTPLDSWIARTDSIIRLDPNINLDEVFLHHEKRKIYQDGVLSFKGCAFEVPPILIGRKVDVYYDPHPPITKLFIRCDGKDYGEVKPVDTYANTKVKRNGDFLKNLETQDDEAPSTGFMFSPINARAAQKEDL